MPGKPLDFDVVCELAQALPDVEVITGPRGPSLKISGRLLACPAINKSAEPHSLVVKIGFDQRASLIEEDPDVYYVTDHYVNYPSVLVRLSRIRRDSLRGLLRMACKFVGNKATTRTGIQKRGRSKIASR
jgi:hypothetical protein